MKRNLLFVSGGIGRERDVALASAKNVRKYVDQNQYDVISVVILPTGVWTLEDSTAICHLINENGKGVLLVNNGHLSQKIVVDLIFPVLHGDAEDGVLLGLFQSMKLPYVGTKKLGSVLCFDKLTAKKLAIQAGIPIVPFIDHFLNPVDYHAACKELKTSKLCVKPSNSGSTFGVSVANDEDSFKKAIDFAREFDEYIVIEKYIENVREVFCAILADGESLITADPGLLNAGAELFDFDLKYSSGSSADVSFDFSAFPAGFESHVRELSKKIFRILRCDNYSRIDYLVDIWGNLYFSEVNTIPGMGDRSLFFKMFKHSGYEPSNLVAKILSNEKF